MKDSQSPEGLNRRDFSRLGLAAGGFVLTAPTIRTIEFAGKVVGSEPPKTTTSVGVTGTSVTTAPLATTTTTVGLTGTEQTTSTTAGTSPSAAGAVQDEGSLPLTGAAIGGAAMLGAAAVAIGRAISRAHRSGPIDQPPGDIG